MILAHTVYNELEPVLKDMATDEVGILAALVYQASHPSLIVKSRIKFLNQLSEREVQDLIRETDDPLGRIKDFLANLNKEDLECVLYTICNLLDLNLEKVMECKND